MGWFFPTPKEYVAKIDMLAKRFAKLMRENPELRRAKSRMDLMGKRIDSGRGTDAQVRVALREARRILAKSR